MEFRLTEVDRILTIRGMIMPPLKRAPLASGPLCDLMDALHQLHLVAGYPSTRDLQRDLGGRDAPSHAAIHKVFASSRVPTWRLVEPLVQVMARRASREEKPEIERFRTLWTRAAASGSTGAVPEAIVAVPVEGRETEPTAETEPLSRYLSEVMPDLIDLRDSAVIC